LEALGEFTGGVVGRCLFIFQLCSIEIEVFRMGFDGPQPVERAVVHGFVQVPFERPRDIEPGALLPEFYKNLLHEIFRRIEIAIGQAGSIPAQRRIPLPENGLESRFVAVPQGCRLGLFVLMFQNVTGFERMETPWGAGYPDAIKKFKNYKRSQGTSHPTVSPFDFSKIRLRVNDHGAQHQNAARHFF
jgi:hypothetical protein